MSVEFNEINELEQVDLTFDEDWIKEALQEEQSYSRFYKTPVKRIVCYSMFVDLSGNIVKLNRQYIDTKENGVIEHSDIMNIISNDTKDKFKNFRIIHTLNYNIHLEPADIHNFINDYDTDEIKKNYLKECSYTSDIIFKDTINYLHPINSLLLIYKQKHLLLSNLKGKDKMNQKINNMNKSKKIFHFVSNKNKHNITRKK